MATPPAMGSNCSSRPCLLYTSPREMSRAPSMWKNERTLVGILAMANNVTQKESSEAKKSAKLRAS